MLNQVMDEVGANVEIRNLWTECFTTAEILHTLAFRPDYTVYHFGSSVEGTSITAMIPDRDAVFIDNRFPVITNRFCPLGSINLLLIQDSITPAGYAKLQLVCNGIPQYENLPVLRFPEDSGLLTSVDDVNRLVCYYAPLMEPGHERHGPAICMKFQGGSMTSDLVKALNCSEWPVCASEWFTRTRNFNWPSPDVVDRCKTLGCLLVPVGHQRSDERNKQWRLSFSHQERLLVTQFNSVQLKCYILLKFVKKDVLKSLIGHESLSSYHLKTCMFYLIENTPNGFWQPANLLACFVTCLHLLLIWSNNGICPNYFIPAENMFDRFSLHIQMRLNHEIQNILSSDCACILAIKTADVGAMLKKGLIQTVSTGPLQIILTEPSRNTNTKIALMADNAVIVQNHKYELLDKSFSESLEIFLKNIWKNLKELKSIKKITTHSENETILAISQIVPHVELVLMTGLISLVKQQGKCGDEIWPFLSSELWYELSLRSYRTVRLKQASLLFTFGYFHASLNVLTDLEHINAFTQCYCYDDCTITPSFKDYSEAVKTRPTYSIVNRLLTPCSLFLPTERDVTPEAICYEMLRFDEAPPGFNDNLVEECLKKCALLDSQFLLYFLLYLNHNSLNMNSHVDADIDNMERIIASGDSCSHRESCLNVLGWVYKDQGRVDRAVQCFKKSLKIKSVANAAIKHMKRYSK